MYTGTRPKVALVWDGGIIALNPEYLWRSVDVHTQVDALMDAGATSVSLCMLTGLDGYWVPWPYDWFEVYE